MNRKLYALLGLVPLLVLVPGVVGADISQGTMLPAIGSTKVCGDVLCSEKSAAGTAETADATVTKDTAPDEMADEPVMDSNAADAMMVTEGEESMETVTEEAPEMKMADSILETEEPSMTDARARILEGAFPALEVLGIKTMGDGKFGAMLDVYSKSQDIQDIQVRISSDTEVIDVMIRDIAADSGVMAFAVIGASDPDSISAQIQGYQMDRPKDLDASQRDMSMRDHAMTDDDLH